MNILELYRDYGIHHQTEGHKHCRPGWVNTPCPFCTGNPGLHLGCTIQGGHFYCWRCGWHPASHVIAKLLEVNEQKAKSIIRQYKGFEHSPEPAIQIRRRSHKLPSGITPLLPIHRKYLKKRNFDPDQLEREWELVGTGPIAMLDHLNFKFRIIAPIFWQGQQVSFQSRDITDKHPLKYITCPKDREIIDHKHILYGKEERWSDSGIWVEGITDVWRLGEKAFCSFGVEYTQKQVRLAARQFKRIVVVFDDEPQAQLQADKLVGELGFRGVDAEKITIKGDPAELTNEEAEYLINSVL